MWEFVKNIGDKSKINNMYNNVNYYDLSEGEKIHILSNVLDENYEIYKRTTEDVTEIMVYDTILNNYYDEEQDDYCNLLNFWNEVVIEELAKC